MSARAAPRRFVGDAHVVQAHPGVFQALMSQVVSGR
jgi:hypothetical protein